MVSVAAEVIQKKIKGEINLWEYFSSEESQVLLRQLGVGERFDVSMFRFIIESICFALVYSKNNTDVFDSVEHDFLIEEFQSLKLRIEDEFSYDDLSRDDDGRYFSPTENNVLAFITEGAGVTTTYGLYAYLLSLWVHAVFRNDIEFTVRESNNCCSAFRKVTELLPYGQKVQAEIVETSQRVINVFEQAESFWVLLRNSDLEQKLLDKFTKDKRKKHAYTALGKISSLIKKLDKPVKGTTSKVSGSSNILVFKAPKNITRNYISLSDKPVNQSVEPFEPVVCEDLSDIEGLVDDPAMLEKLADVNGRSKSNNEIIFDNDSRLKSDYERKKLAETLLKDIKNDKYKFSAFMVSLSILMGRKLDDVLELKVNTENGVFLDGYIIKTIYIPEEMASPHPSIANNYYSYGDKIRLTLPKFLLDVLTELSEANGGELLIHCFGLSKINAKKVIQGYLDCVRDGMSSKSIDYANIHNQIKVYHKKVIKNPVTNSIIFDRPTDWPPIQFWYGSVHVNRVLEEYAQCVSNYFSIDYKPEIERSNYILGSQLKVKEELFKQDISKLIAELDDKSADVLDEFLSFHNSFVAYLALVLFYSTGHRPNVDSFSDLQHFMMELGILIVNDKQTTRTHRNRLVFLSDLALRQIEKYKNHLKELAIFFNKQGDEKSTALARRISDLINCIDSKQEHDLPFLFFINDELKTTSISKSSLRHQLGDSWSHAYNHSRHFLQTGLTDMGVESVFVDCLLGHIARDHLFDSNLDVTPYQMKQAIKPATDKLLNEAGFKVLDGLKVSPTDKVRDRLFSQIKPLKTTKKLRVKPSSSSINRNLCASELSGIIETVCGKHKGKELRHLTVEQQGKIRDLIDERLVKFPDRLTRTHSLLTRFVRQSNHQNDSNVFFYYKYPLMPKESPIKDDWIFYFSKAFEIKRKFITELGFNSAASKPTAERRLAEIVLSICLFGGVSNKKILRNLLKGFPDNFIRREQDFYIEFFAEEDEMSYRFMCDSVTKSLVESFNQTCSKQKVCKRKLNRELQSLFRAIGLNFRSVDNNLNKLAELFKSYWFFFLPHQYIHAIDKHQYTTLPDHAFYRSYYSRPIEEVEPAVNEALYQDIILPKERVDTFILSKDLNSDLRKLFNRMMDASKKDLLCVSLEQSEQNKYKYTIRRKKLSEIAGYIEETYLVPKKAKTLSEVDLLLLHWLVYTCRLNISAKSYCIKVSTLKRYFYALKKLQGLGLSNLKSMSGEEWGSLYNNFFKMLSSYAQQYTYPLLEDFHKFISSQAGIQKCSWNLVEYEDKPFRANANYLTESEYNQYFLSLLDSNVMNNEKLCALAAAIGGYRFGLRVSEVENSYIDDVQIDNEKVSWYVRNHQKDILKTGSSSRLVIPVGDLSNDEVEVLKSLKQSASLNKNNKHLFITNSIVKKPEDIYELVSTPLKRFLKDKTFKFHHLRHSFCMSVFDVIFTKNTTFPLAHVSRLLGHASIKTTISSYLHTLEKYIVIYAEHANQMSITLPASMYLLNNFSRESVKRDARRKHCDKNDDYGYWSLVGMRKQFGITPKEKRKFIDYGELLFSESTVTAKELSLTDARDILQWHAERKSYDALEAHLSVPVQQIKQFIASAKYVAAVTEFDPYNLLQLDSDLASSSGVIRSKEQSKDQTNIENLLKRMDSSGSDIKSSLSKSWMAAYTSGKGEFNFKSTGQLISMHQVLREFEFKSSMFDTKIYGFTDNDQLENIKDKLHKQGFKNIAAEGKKYSTPRISSFLKKGTKPVNYHKSLNKAVYVNSSLLNYQQSERKYERKRHVS